MTLSTATRRRRTAQVGRRYSDAFMEGIVSYRTPFPGKGLWLKGNTHVHSRASDGGKAFDELEALYAGAGYDFLFRTDHWVCSKAPASRRKSRLIWLDGMELDGKDYRGASYHVVCLGRLKGIVREMGFVPALEAARAQGAILILAHPQWMGNTFEDALRWGFHGVEIYNHVCNWLNGKGDGLTHWNALLSERPATFGVASDDAHLQAEHPGWNGGWIVARVRSRTPEAIRNAISRGEFYSSRGPSFEAVSFDGRNIALKTSPVQFARVVGSRWNGHRVGGFDGRLFTEATLPFPSNVPYAYLEIEDAQGRRAWTNNIVARD
jgi:hypothetical protein